MAADTVPPLISAQLNYLLTRYPLSIKVDQLWSGSKNHNLLDRFTLRIPFCLDYIKWDVIYNAQYPLAAPDVVFGPDDENFHPFHVAGVAGEGEGNVLPKNSLCDWNSKDPSRLLSLIHELRQLYMSYQRKRVGELDDDRLKFEVSTIVSREGIEMCMSSVVEKSEEVKFAVPLMDMDINKLVPGCPWRHQQKIYLQVVFPVSKKYLTTPPNPRLKLVASSELKALFSVEDVKLPPWLDGMCMAGYLPNLEEILERQVLEAISFIDVRRRFIEALAPQFGRPVEADPIFCRKATFFAVSGVFTFMVHFSLSAQFPKQQPGIMLQSCQHFNVQGIPIKSPVRSDYPWSPRWETSLMAEKLFEFLADECLNFKKYCSEIQLQQH